MHRSGGEGKSWYCGNAGLVGLEVGSEAAGPETHPRSEAVMFLWFVSQVQIQNKKVDISKVYSKCGSKANIKHKPGECCPPDPSMPGACGPAKTAGFHPCSSVIP